MTLDVPGVEADRYSTVFCRLARFEIRRYPARRIFYGPIFWTSDPHPADNGVIIDLYCGQNDALVNSFLIRPYQVHIDWARWSRQRRRTVANNIDAARSEGRARYNPPSQAGCWVFFLGDQDTQDPALFHVDDYQLLCFLPVDGVYDDAQETPWRHLPQRSQT